MALETGPMRVEHKFFTTKAEVLEDIEHQELWPTILPLASQQAR